MLVACPGCKSTLNLRDDLIGKAIRCGKCAMVLRIPVAIPTPILESPPVSPAPMPPPATMPAPAAAPQPQAIQRPIEFAASRVPAPPPPAEEEAWVATPVDDEEPPMEDGTLRQRHVVIPNKIPYDEFGRIAWPAVPAPIVFAGLLWCFVAVVCLFRIVFPLLMIATSRDRVPEGVMVMACVVIFSSIFFGVVFFYIGVTTTKGTAGGTIGNGLGSLVLGGYHAFALVSVYLWPSQAALRRSIGGGCHGDRHSHLYAAALIFAAIFCFLRSNDYQEMRYQRKRIQLALNDLERNDWRERD